MSDTIWQVRFGKQHDGSGEYFAHVRDSGGDPVDTFYGGIEDVFEGVGMLMASEASGTGLGAPIRENVRTDDA